jgi:hypothetical protein
VVVASSEYRVNIIISSKDKTSAPAKKADKSLLSLANAAKIAAAGYAAVKVAQEAIKFVEFGAKVQQAETALNSLAQGAGTTGDAIVDAIQGAADFTIDRMSAMEAANKALLLGVAKSPEDFERLSKQAVLLGRAMGQDAAKSIDDFVTAAGRQSKQIADNLGLMVSAEDANKKYAEAIGKTVDELTDAERKQAFMTEMLIQAEDKTKDLEGATGGAAFELGLMKAAVSDTKAELALMAAETFDNTVNTQKLALAIREIPDALREAQDRQVEFSASLGEAEAFLSGDVLAVERYTVAVEESSPVITGYNGLIADGVSTMGLYSKAVSSTTSMLVPFSTASTGGANSQAALEKTVLGAITAIENEAKAVATLTEKTLGLQSSLKGATEAQIAQTAIGELSRLYEQGEISTEDYATAVTETQLAFGLADEKSIALTKGILDLTAKFADGTVKAEDFDSALLATIKEADTLNASLSDTKKAIEELPEEKTVTINVRYLETGRPSALGAGGGNVTTGSFNTTNNVVVGDPNAVTGDTTADTVLESLEEAGLLE